MLKQLVIVACLASRASGAMPRILGAIEREGTLGAIATGKLRSLDDKVKALLLAAEGPAYPGLSRLLDALGARKSIDLEGSAAIVLLPPVDDASPPRAALALPVSDGEALLRSLQASPDEGAMRIELGGAPYFTRALTPRLLLFSADRAALETIHAATDPARSWAHDLGPLGEKICAEADVVGVAGAADLAKVGASLLSRAGNPATMPPPSSFIARLGALAAAEGRNAVLGLSAVPHGLRIDLAATFNPDGVMTRAAQTGMAPAEPALALMSAKPYLLALGVDAAHPGVRILADELGTPPRIDTVWTSAEKAILRAIPEMDAAAVVVHEPPSIMFGALSGTVIAWRSPTPEHGANEFRDWISSLNRRPVEVRAGEAAFITSTFSPGATSIGGKPADAWSITPPPGAAPMLPMLLGQMQGVRGVLVRAEDRAYLSWSKDSALLESAVKAGADEMPALSKNALLANVAAHLPAGRFVEAYLNITPLAKQAGSMMKPGMLHGMPDDLPPIGAALSAEQGSMHASVFVPMTLLKLGLRLAGSAEPSR